MTTEKMTIHRALAEMKTLDKRIEGKIKDTTFCLANRHNNEKVAGYDLEAYKQRVKENYQSICDLINRREAMKRAIVLSNAVTEVEIAGRKYRVAEAIEMKKSGMDNKKCLLAQINTQYTKVQKTIDTENGQKLQDAADRYIIAVTGNMESIKNLTEETQKLRDKYMADNTYDLIDPLDILSIKSELDAEIENFLSEVDAALSCSNAITEVEFSY